VLVSGQAVRHLTSDDLDDISILIRYEAVPPAAGP
jgi:hypothetical protein